MNKQFSDLELESLIMEFFGSSNVRRPALVKINMDLDGDKVFMEDPAQVALESIIGRYDQDAVAKARVEPRAHVGEHKPIYKSDKMVQEYIHLSDFHIPFHVSGWVDDIMKEHSFKGKILIINGDFLDCHDVSSFPKSKAVGLNNEVNLAKALLRDWSKRFDKIYLIAGNHEKRMATYIRKRISPEVVALVEDDILKNIIDDIKLPNIIYMPGDTTNWYCQIDNVICCHPNDYKRSNSGILHTATFALPYFEAYHSDANVFIMAHTHHLGIGIFRGKVISEAGCLCQQQDYAASGNLSYTPQARGYLEFTSRNGRVGFNDIKLHYLG